MENALIATIVLIATLLGGLAALWFFWDKLWFFLDKMVQKMRVARQNKRRLIRQSKVLPGFTSKWLIEYYLRRNKLHDLFIVRHDERRGYIPFLTKATWHGGPFKEDKLIRYSPELRKSNAKVDKSLIRHREKLQQKVWNDPLLCVFSTETHEKTPQLEVGICDYYQYLSACGSLEEEAYRAINRPGSETPLRDKYASSINTLRNCPLGAHGLGIQVVVIYRDGGGAKVLIQERSYSTVIYGGAWAVVPTFGCMPVSLDRPHEVSLFHNFLREFYEELYSIDELIKHESSRLDPKWFYRKEPVAKIRSMHEVGELKFEILGFGFDALNTEVNVAVLAFFDNDKFIQEEMQRMQKNWEVKKVLKLDIESSQLWELIFGNKFQPGSAFAITKAITRLKSHYLEI